MTRPRTGRPNSEYEGGGGRTNAPATVDDGVLKQDHTLQREADHNTDSSGDATYVASQPNPSDLAPGTPEGLRSRPGKQRQDTGNGFAAEDSQPDEKDGKKGGKKAHSWFTNVQPKEKFTVGNQIRRTLFNSWLNILILAAPAGIVMNYVGHVNGIIIFVINFIAIIPLAAMLSFATEEIALRTGETLGGLLNATFG
jgi:Ca2+:H+ antiporter